ncbi:hypothetical protein ACJX0J_006330 [Zea mays]
MANGLAPEMNRLAFDSWPTATPISIFADDVAIFAKLDIEDLEVYIFLLLLCLQILGNLSLAGLEEFIQSWDMHICVLCDQHDEIVGQCVHVEVSALVFFLLKKEKEKKLGVLQKPCILDLQGVQNRSLLNQWFVLGLGKISSRTRGTRGCMQHHSYMIMIFFLNLIVFFLELLNLMKILVFYHLHAFAISFLLNAFNQIIT